MAKGFRDFPIWTFPDMIQFGNGAVNNVGLHARNFGAKNVLVVTDKGVIEAGILSRVTDSLDKARVPYAVFSGVQPNPTNKNVEAGLKVYKEGNHDVIISVGGGSPMDAAKAIGLMATHPGKIEDYRISPGGTSKIKPILPKNIAVPTTSGTGSEVSRGSVITDVERNVKYAVGGPSLRPSLALVDPDLTLSMPPALTAMTGMDALTHAVEAYVSKQYSPIFEAIAIGAIKLVAVNLRGAVTNGRDIEARKGMSMASVMGAMAFSKGLGAVHSLAHQLSPEAGIPHGLANAILLPQVMRFNLPYATEKLADVAQAMGVNTTSMAPEEAANAAIEAVVQLSKDVGTDKRLGELGLKRESIPRISKNAMADHCHAGNPRECTEEDMAALFEAAL